MTALSKDEGCLAAVPANDNQLAALGVAIGKGPDVSVLLPSGYGGANDNYPPIVAFTGLAGSGKSTATKYLVDQHGYTLVKFAGPLKDMCRALGMSEDEIEGDLKEVPAGWLGGRSPRHAMQTLGTQWARKEFGDDFWVNKWKASASSVIYADGRVVVDDCRFPNEAAAVRKLGGDIYRLVGRGGIPGQHESERGCGDEDLVIANDNEPEALYLKVEDALRRYG